MNDAEAPTAGTEAEVDLLLALAGIAPSPDEVAALVVQYPGLRLGVEALHDLPEARYEVPALVFLADPRFADWAG